MRIHTYKQTKDKFMLLIVLLDEILRGLFSAQAVVQKYYGISHFSVEFFDSDYVRIHDSYGIILSFSFPYFWFLHLFCYMNVSFSYVYYVKRRHISLEICHAISSKCIYEQCAEDSALRDHVHIRKFP